MLQQTHFTGEPVGTWKWIDYENCNLKKGMYKYFVYLIAH